jgi:hypothetical protein
MCFTYRDRPEVPEAVTRVDDLVGSTIESNVSYLFGPRTQWKRRQNTWLAKMR